MCCPCRLALVAQVLALEALGPPGAFTDLHKAVTGTLSGACCGREVCRNYNVFRAVYQFGSHVIGRQRVSVCSSDARSLVFVRRCSPQRNRARFIYSMYMRGWSVIMWPSSAGHTDAVRALRVVGERLFSGSYDGSVRAWSTASLLPEGCMRQHSGPVRILVPSGRCIFSGSYDGTVCAWHTDVRSLPCSPGQFHQPSVPVMTTHGSSSLHIVGGRAADAA